jgi:hypothetical protein
VEYITPPISILKNHPTLAPTSKLLPMSPPTTSVVPSVQPNLGPIYTSPQINYIPKRYELPIANWPQVRLSPDALFPGFAASQSVSLQFLHVRGFLTDTLSRPLLGLFRRIVSNLSEEGSSDDIGIPPTKVVEYKGWKLFLSIMGKRVGIIAGIGFIICCPKWLLM